MPTMPCPTCGNPVPIGDRFCGQCGARIEAPPAPTPGAGKTMFFSGVQVSGVAKLVVVKANSADGLAYELGGTEHVVGRTDGAILFPDDPLVSPLHANFLYRRASCSCATKTRSNGVFLRIRSPSRLESGAVFLLGEQLLQVEALTTRLRAAARFRRNLLLRQPKRASKMRVISDCAGGRDRPHRGAPPRDSITLGREGNDLNFPDDPSSRGATPRLASAGWDVHSDRRGIQEWHFRAHQR